MKLLVFQAINRSINKFDATLGRAYFQTKEVVKSLSITIEYKQFCPVTRKYKSMGHDL